MLTGNNMCRMYHKFLQALSYIHVSLVQCTHMCIGSTIVIRILPMSKSSLFLIALFDGTSLRQDSLLSSPSSAVSRLLHSHWRSSGVYSTSRDVQYIGNIICNDGIVHVYITVYELIQVASIPTCRYNAGRSTCRLLHMCIHISSQ